ncbi:hypothetical protein [Sphingosinicella xenopeptidilytica]|uniref:Uncharacterized protein n=1 Tax=Sphingosinicella xenopeptidilytica TaxID=364098 RepID=A0ABW3C972_SPHXN
MKADPLSVMWRFNWLGVPRWSELSIGFSGYPLVDFHLRIVDRGEFSYMLIHEAVKAAVASGCLVPAKPIADWAGQPRVVLLCKQIRDAIDAGRNDENEKERQCWAKVEAVFSHFIEGGRITEDLVKQLRPEKFEHWEFRCRKPKPSIRVFGRFAMPDVFVATHAQPRALLGGMWSPEFEHQKLVCEDHWNACSLHAPFSDAPDFRYEAYITENARRKLKI